MTNIKDIISSNTKVRALYKDASSTPRERKTALQYLRRLKEREDKRKANKLRQLNRIWKRQNRLTKTGFREMYTRYSNEEVSVWYRLSRTKGLSRVAPLEEWLSSGIDKYYEYGKTILKRKNTSKDWTIDNLLVLSKEDRSIIYDPTETAEGGAPLGVSESQPMVGPLEEV